MCECEVCKDISRWRKLIESDNLADRMIAYNEMFERIEIAETDATYYKGILEGHWPNAQGILEAKLEKIRIKNAPDISITP